MKVSVDDIKIQCEVHGEVSYHATSDLDDEIMTISCPLCAEDEEWNAIITAPRFRDAFIEMTMATGLCSQAAATRYCCWLEGLFWWQQ